MLVSIPLMIVFNNFTITLPSLIVMMRNQTVFITLIEYQINQAIPHIRIIEISMPFNAIISYLESYDEFMTAYRAQL